VKLGIRPWYKILLRKIFSAFSDSQVCEPNSIFMFVRIDPVHLLAGFPKRYLNDGFVVSCFWVHVSLCDLAF